MDCKFLILAVLPCVSCATATSATTSKISVSAAGATSTTSGGSSVAASITTTTVVPGSSPAITPGGTAAPVTTKPKTAPAQFQCFNGTCKNDTSCIKTDISKTCNTTIGCEVVVSMSTVTAGCLKNPCDPSKNKDNHWCCTTPKCNVKAENNGTVETRVNVAALVALVASAVWARTTS